MPYEETSYLLPPGFGARHNPGLVFSTTATAWLAWALFLLAGSFSLFTNQGPALVAAWSLASISALAAGLQFYVLRRLGAARIWRFGEHFDAAVLSVQADGDIREVRVRFSDADGIIRLMQLTMPAEDAARVSMDCALRVAFLDGELTYHYLPARQEPESELAM